MTVEEIEHEIGTAAHSNGDGDGDGELSIDFETFSAWWKEHESSPGAQKSFAFGMHQVLHSSCSTGRASHHAA